MSSSESRLISADITSDWADRLNSWPAKFVDWGVNPLSLNTYRQPLVYLSSLDLTIATDVAETMDREALVQAILNLENDVEDQVTDPDLAFDLAGHIKVHVDELVALGAGPGSGKLKRKKTKKARPPKGPIPRLEALPPVDQARWIFMERYIPLERHEDILGLNLPSEVFAEYQESFDRFITNLLLLPRTIQAVEKNDIPALQKQFATCVLVFRAPELIHNDEAVPVSVKSLRDAFPSYFYKRKKKANWFEAHDFYREPIKAPRWVLCDTEHMNCTLRRPERKLAGYARDWGLPEDCGLQKNLVEDLYDRILVGEALEEDLFARTVNSLTTTGYRTRKKGAQRLAFAVQKVHKVTIHGKVGVPHWKAKRRHWPGVYPSLVFHES